MRSVGDKTAQGIAFRSQRGKAPLQGGGHLVKLARQHADLVMPVDGCTR
jgi:hypothetical protein